MDARFSSAFRHDGWRRLLHAVGRLSALLLLLCASGLGSLDGSPARAAEPIEGIWEQVNDDGSVGAWIAMKERDNQVEGTIVRIFPDPGDPPDPVCSRCTGALKNAPVLGLTIIRGLRRTADGYQGGTVLDPDTGSTYQFQATLSPDGQELEVRGFKGLPLFGRTQTWRRHRGAS